MQSDWFGKGVFWALFLLSAISWTILIYKSRQLLRIRHLSAEFASLFEESKSTPLDFQFQRVPQNGKIELWHPFFEVYKATKQTALQLISRNNSKAQAAEPFLSAADLGLIESQANAAAAAQCKPLDQNLFVLSTAAALGPFLGLLGTVWGILLAFGHLPGGHASGNASMLIGLSLALATTVIGLIVAIPALVAHNYLKNASREYKRDLEQFSNLLLAAVEMQYRKE